MEIHQLRYFVAVAEEGNFSHAAEREHDALAFVRQTPRLPRSIQLKKWHGGNEMIIGSIPRGGY